MARGRRRHRLAVPVTGALVALALSTLGVQPVLGASSDTTPGVVGLLSDISDLSLHVEGTGLVLSSDGLILTNNHLISGATSITVRTRSGTKYRAAVLGYDIAADIAVLQLMSARRLKSSEIDTQVIARVGTSVTAVGDSNGPSSAPLVEHGSVTGLNQTIRAYSETIGLEVLNGLIETNLTLQPGDSGGALLDPSGKVIGLTTAGLNEYVGNDNEGFAIPIDTALAIASAIEHNEASANVHVGPTAFLGAVVQNVAYNGIGPVPTPGALVQSIVPSSPAARAGLLPGDVIVGLDGRAVTSQPSLMSLLLDTLAPSKVPIEWLSSTGQRVTTTVSLSAGAPF